MAANDKYSKMMKGLKPNKAVQEKPEVQNQRGGKRSNPDYRGTTFFLRKNTLMVANQLLIGGEAGNMDLSDLLESLLAEWVAKRTAGKK
jgi:hypothetical protein